MLRWLTAPFRWLSSRRDRRPSSPKELQALRLRLEEFSIDQPGALKPFSVRLAIEQDWTTGFTHRVIEEYKRFMFMCTVSETPMTPSHTVDEAWHLHLIYSRSYWEEFCLHVLRRLIHHDPGTGSEGDAEALNEQYMQTLETYRKLFGEEPPDDIWGPHNGRNVKKKR